MEGQPDPLAPKVLVVDDDPGLLEMARHHLQREGLDTIVASDGHAALRQMYEARPSLVLLDLGLPGLDGYEVCRLIRDMSDVPIAILTGKNDRTSAVRCLDLGADEYFVKPMDGRELAARVKALLRRATLAGRQRLHNQIRMGDIEIDIDGHTVKKKGKPVALTPTEFRVLQLLVEAQGKVLSHRVILMKIWGQEYTRDTHYLRLYIGYLRQKLENDPKNPELIVNEWGIGYRLGSPDDQTSNDASDSNNLHMSNS